MISMGCKINFKTSQWNFSLLRGRSLDSQAPPKCTRRGSWQLACTLMALQLSRLARRKVKWWKPVSSRMEDRGVISQKVKQNSYEADLFLLWPASSDTDARKQFCLMNLIQYLVHLRTKFWIDLLLLLLGMLYHILLGVDHSCHQTLTPSC